jgi:hypothetical protein
MWYMMCHFVLSKVVRYHFVLIHHQLILLSSQVLAQNKVVFYMLKEGTIKVWT